MPTKKSINKSHAESAENAHLGKRNRYKDACEQIKESVQRYIATHNINIELDTVENEDDLAQEEILEKVYKDYAKGDVADRTDQHLQDAFQTGGLVCLICIDNIQRSDPIWSCDECFCSFHLPCIQKWGKDSIFLQAQALEERLASNPYSRDLTKDFVWCCPKCRFSYTQFKIPSMYKCFCTKKVDPPFDPWLIPHSCGEKCGKKLRPDCGHTCLLLCHPGPCPPCPVIIRAACYCGQDPPEVRRCSSKEWSCGSACDQLLGCRHHKCPEACHRGECPPCPRLSNQTCFCGASAQMRPCADPSWHCEKVCEKPLSCGHHSCQTICHSGPCGNCPSSGERSCPCGKTSSVLPCTQLIPTCGDTCSKVLLCGRHNCQERCHKGDCPPCRQLCVKQCVCGSREKEVPCWKDFTCEIKCKRIRDCKKHTCNKKCCTDCPPCGQQCGKTLGCGNHKCESRCHPGRCYPCAVTHQLLCACGKTSITVPCGRERKTPPPKCAFNCKKRPDCHHPKREDHRCHSGPCPPCKIVCGMTLPCSHKCPAPCHDAVAVKVTDNQKPAGPWEVKSAQIQIKKLPHPSCKVKVPNICEGKHETQQWPCSEVRPYSCGKICGRKLPCTNHVCEKECHFVEGQKGADLSGTNCNSCSLPCKKPRPEGCSHVCMLPCHMEECPPCAQKIKFKCHCGILDVTVVCQEWLREDSFSQDKIRSCTNQCNKQIECGHSCVKQCHGGQCSSANACRKKIGMRCTCKRIKKDFPCHAVTSGQAIVKCDQVCLEKAQEKKKLAEEEKQKKEEEEEKLRKKELEEYKRFIEGNKRKRPRKIKAEVVQETPWWRKNSNLLISGVILVLSICFYFIIVNAL